MKWHQGGKGSWGSSCSAGERVLQLLLQLLAAFACHLITQNIRGKQGMEINVIIQPALEYKIPVVGGPRRGGYVTGLSSSTASDSLVNSF